MAKTWKTPRQRNCSRKRATAGRLQDLLERHRERLRRMIAVRLDSRLGSLVDPSDVVQDALADASQKLDGYLRDRPLPFYPWLRKLAEERIIQLHRRHLGTQKRSVTREQRLDLAFPDSSADKLADCLVASGTSPSQQVVRNEQASGCACCSIVSIPTTARSW